MPENHHLPWGAEALWQQLAPLLPGLSVEIVARTDSTNTQLLERARRAGALDDATTAATHGRRAGDTQPCLLVAEAQTRGRGRQGRTWYSSPGASLTFSLSLPLHPADWSGLSLAVGLALAETLDPQADAGPQAALPPPPGGVGSSGRATSTRRPPRIGLKWPNDLMLREGDGPGRKLGGILIETVPVGPRRMAVVGIGLNISPLALKDLSLGYACLQELEPDIDAPQALARLALPLVQALRAFERGGFAPLQARYARRDALAGHAVTTTLPELPGGTAEAVDRDGALLLRTPGGLHRISSGEVSVRLDEPGGALEAPAC